MRIDTLIPAASVAPTPLSGATADCPQQAANRGVAANRGAPFGPLTTHRMEGAGGPFNRLDCDIAAAHRRGNHQLAERLQVARARINLAFELLEPVWVPTASQRAMLRLRAGAIANGLCTMKAAA